MAKILLHTLGSSGDFNPFMALALELRRRGHAVHFAVSPTYAEQAQMQGFAATAVGPDPDLHADLLQRLLQPARNGIHLVNLLFREVLIPSIAPATTALEPLCRESDLFVSHTIQLAAPVVAARTGTPWVSASAAALIYPTADYPPPGVAWKGCPAPLSRLGWGIGRQVFRPLDARANVEYRKLGAPPVRDVVLGGAYSRRLTLGLWSPSYLPRPADWPDWFQIGGYGRWDAPPSAPTPPPSVPSGEGPLIVFTLGSSVVSDPRGFYESALEAVAPTGWRALLLGASADLRIPASLRDRVGIVPYARYSDVFPSAGAVVHTGGVGTTQAACYYGIPALIVPRAADQFENAAHLQRNGWGLRLLPWDLSPRLLRRRLDRLLGAPEIRRRAAVLGERMRAEAGMADSAELLESVL